MIIYPSGVECQLALLVCLLYTPIGLYIKWAQRGTTVTARYMYTLPLHGVQCSSTMYSWTNCESTSIYMYKLSHPSLPGLHYTVYSAWINMLPNRPIMPTHRITGLLESARSILASLQCKYMYSMIQFAIWNVIILFYGWQIVDERESNCYVLT